MRQKSISLPPKVGELASLLSRSTYGLLAKCQVMMAARYWPSSNILYVYGLRPIFKQ